MSLSAELSQRSPLQASSSIEPEDELPSIDLETCLRSCAEHSSKLVSVRDARRARLGELLRRLLALYASQPLPAVRPTGVRSLLSRSRQRPVRARLGQDLRTSLQETADAALETGNAEDTRLALLIADTVLGTRKESKIWWRMRAVAQEKLGREKAALASYQTYLERSSDDSTGVAARVAGMRHAAQARRNLIELLAARAPLDGPQRSVAQAWTDGLESRDRGDIAGAQTSFAEALVQLGRERTGVKDFNEALGLYLELATLDTPYDPAIHELAGEYAELRRSRLCGPVADPTFGGVQWLTVGEFRNKIAGRSVCLVANSGRVGAGTMGDRIDGYDLVVRFNSYKVDPVATGRRTDIHVTIHLHDFNWRQPVWTRLVFGGQPSAWRESVRNRLVPGAQQYVGDDSLAYPVRRIGKLGPEEWNSIPTTGFNMVFLLDFLNVNPVIDLIGFDFYQTGAYRVDDAMDLPISSVHEYGDEKAWVLQRAQHVDDMRISLR